MANQIAVPESKLYPQNDLKHRMQGIAKYVAWGIYVVLLLIILGLAIRGIPGAIKALDLIGRHTTYNAVRVFLFYPVGFGIISLFLFLRRSDDWFVFLVSLALLLYGGNNLTVWEGARSMGLNPLSVFINTAGGVLINFLFLTFPSGSFVPAWTRKYFKLILAWAFVSFFLNVFSEHIPWLAVDGFGWYVIDWIWQIFAAAGIFAQIYRFRYISTPIEQQQVKWVVIMLPISLLLTTSQMLFLTLYTVNPYSSETLKTIDDIWRGLQSLADLSVGIGAVLAMYRYKLWESDFYLNRSLIFGTVTAMLAGLWWAGTVLVQFSLNNIIKQQSSPLIVTLLSLIPAASLFQPLRDATQKWVNALIYKDQLDFTKVIVELQPENWQFVSLRDIAQAVMKNTARLLGIDKAGIYVVDSGTLRLMETIGITPDEANQFNETNISELRKGKVMQFDKERPFNMFVPLVVPRGRAHDLIGVLALGPRAQNRGYSRDQRNNLEILGVSAGMAIHFLQLNEIKNVSR